MLAVIAYHDGTGGAWPSDELIALESGVRFRGSVVAARNGLRAKGRLRWTHARHTNIYEIAYREPHEFDSHCPGNPDTDSHCPGKPDTDHSHCPGNPTLTVRETRTRTRSNRGEALAGEGKGRRASCREGEACGFRLRPDDDRCMLCGIVDSWPF